MHRIPPPRGNERKRARPVSRSSSSHVISPRKRPIAYPAAMHHGTSTCIGWLIRRYSEWFGPPLTGSAHEFGHGAPGATAGAFLLTDRLRQQGAGHVIRSQQLLLSSLMWHSSLRARVSLGRTDGGRAARQRRVVQCR